MWHHFQISNVKFTMMCCPDHFVSFRFFLQMRARCEFHSGPSWYSQTNISKSQMLTVSLCLLSHSFNEAAASPPPMQCYSFRCLYDTFCQSKPKRKTIFLSRPIGQFQCFLSFQNCLDFKTLIIEKCRAMALVGWWAGPINESAPPRNSTFSISATLHFKLNTFLTDY